MPRMSREQTEAHHAEVLTAAARLVRERGVDGVSVPAVMAAAGMTHGGFYRHFTSKDDLIGQAFATAMGQRLAEMDTIADTAAEDGRSAREDFLGVYLSAAHRDNPGLGCALAALAGDAGRAEPDSPLRRAYADGLRHMAERLAALDHDAAGQRPVLADLATLVGAVALARACGRDELSAEILAAAGERLAGS